MNPDRSLVVAAGARAHVLPATPPSCSPRSRPTRWKSCSGQTKLLPLPKGELLFSQGDPSDELFVVSEGRIAIATRSTDGRESMVAVLEAGGLFGELGLFDDEPRSADARALTDSEVVGARLRRRARRAAGATGDPAG